MTKYVVRYRAEGTVKVEAETSEVATEKALDRVLDLEHADASLTVVRVEQVQTHEAS